jgi:alkaline phosphatase D
MNPLFDLRTWLDRVPDPVGRRDFMRRCAALGLLWTGAPLESRRQHPVRFRVDPFSLGVASGDPLPDGIVLWTRLAPEPLMPGGGLSRETVSVDWEVARDERFTSILKRGSVEARPESAHSVHVEVDGLEPDRGYWYRFIAGGEASPAARTRTAPAIGARLDEMRFAVASCQHYEQGYYTALRHLADEDVRLLAFLGDYIYENGALPDRPRQHGDHEIRTLDDYRIRYALYKSDADLQAAHAAMPWILTWDDHEVDNNYAGDHDEAGSPPAEFLLRRAAAYQAYYEHLPMRRAVVPAGPYAQMYRRLAFGSLIDMHVLDTRQYRTDQPCGDGIKARCEGAFDAAATMMGEAQERWLMDGLSRSHAQWNVLANQVPIAQIDNLPGDDATYSMDRWDGYVEARRRLLSFLESSRPANPIVLTGDIHSNWVAELKPDFEEPSSPTVGVEFIATSISSGGDGADGGNFGAGALAANPHIRFFNGQRGYIRCAVTPSSWTSDYRVVEYVSRPGAPIRTRASFVVEAGRPGVQST